MRKIQNRNREPQSINNGVMAGKGRQSVTSQPRNGMLLRKSGKINPRICFAHEKLFFFEKLHFSHRQNTDTLHAVIVFIFPAKAYQ